MIAYLIIGLGIIIRVLSHASGFAFFPPNFAPIGGMALFAGAHLSGKKTVLMPLVALLISDYFIGFYNIWVMVSVYASFAAIFLIGRLLKSRQNLLAIGGASVSSSLLFFLITNFAVWAGSSHYYPAGLDGLIASYVAGLPFLKYTLAGDLFYTSAFFLAFALASSMAKYIQTVKLKSGHDRAA